MRAVFGVLSLLVVVAIVGVLVKKQISGVTSVAPAPTQAPAAGAPALSGSPQQQQQQFKQAVEGAMQVPQRDESR